jgi:O-antigen/teichoic acid export membrane protein
VTSGEDATSLRGDQAAGPAAQQLKLYARGLKYSAYDSATMLVLGLASAVVTARVFGAEVIGAFALTTLLTGSLHMVSNVREQGGLVRELTHFEPGAPEARALLWLTLAFSVALTAAVLIPFGALSVFLLSDVFDHPELLGPFAVLAATYLAIDNTAFNFEAPLVAYRDGRAVWIARSAVTVTMIVGAAACALLDERSIWGLVVITVAASIAGMALRFHAVWRLLGLRTDAAQLRRVRPRLRSIIWFGARQTPLNYTESAVEYADTAVLGATVSLGAIGAYNRAYTLYRRAGQVPLALGRLYFPTLTALLARGETEAVLRVYLVSTRYLILLLLPASTWLAACAPGVLKVFGPGFDQAAGALAILAFVLVLDGYAKTAGGLLSALDRPGVVSLVSVGSAVVNVTLCLLLIEPLGLEGAALANAGGWALECAVLMLLCASAAGRPALKMLEGRFLARLIAACALAGACLAAARGLPAALVWQLLATVPAFGAGLVIFRPVPREGAPSVEAVLTSAGVRSPRFLRVATRLHDAISHGPHSSRRMFKHRSPR